MKKLIDGEWVTIEDLYQKHEKFMLKMCHRYRRVGRSSGLDLDDLMSLCKEALIISFKKFDESKGVKFLTYYGMWAKNRILREAQQNNPLSIPNDCYALAGQIQKNDDVHLNAEEIAKKYEFPLSKAKDVIRYLSVQYMSMDFMYGDTEDAALHEAVGFEEDETAVTVNEFLATLSQQQQEIIRLRFKGETYRDIGKQYGVSRTTINNNVKKIGELWEKYDKGRVAI